MLRFIVYRYISYKDSKISHASLLALRHHLSQPPSPTTPPHCPTTYTCPTPPSPTTHLTAPPPAPTTSTCPTPPCSTTHLTAPPPAPTLLHYSAIYPRSAYPTYVHTAPYPLLRFHLLHILSRTPHTRATLHTAQPISPTDAPCPPYTL